nr:MAG TPA: Repressor protein CI [Caudoviricetes sp.]
MPSEIYERFEKLKERKDVSSYAVSKGTGITTTTLTNWKKGKYTPKQDKLQLIADYFGVTLDYLVNGEEKEITVPEQTDLWIAIRKDKKLLEALEKYMSLSDKKKKHVIDTIDVLSEK